MPAEFTPFCARCGAHNDDQARFCHRCGAAFHAAEPQPDEPVPTTVRRPAPGGPAAPEAGDYVALDESDAVTGAFPLSGPPPAPRPSRRGLAAAIAAAVVVAAAAGIITYRITHSGGHAVAAAPAVTSVVPSSSSPSIAPSSRSARSPSPSPSPSPSNLFPTATAAAAQAPSDPAGQQSCDPYEDPCDSSSEQATTVYGGDGTSYPFVETDSDRIVDCAGNAYGSEVTGFLSTYPCDHAHRVLGTITVDGRQAVISVITVSFADDGTNSSFQDVENADNHSGMDDLLRTGYSVAGFTQIPYHEVFSVQSYVDDTDTEIFDAWWVDGSTSDNDTSLSEMEYNLDPSALTPEG